MIQMTDEEKRLERNGQLKSMAPTVMDQEINVEKAIEARLQMASKMTARPVTPNTNQWFIRG